jgi:hypothetical protein
VLASGGVTGWQILPVEADDFEESVLRVCALVRAGDVRIGKVPKPRRKSAKTSAKPAKTSAKPAKTSAKPAKRRRSS